MFEWFGLSILHNDPGDSIYLGSGSLSFGCDNNMIWVGLMFCSMKLKLIKAQQSSLKLVEVRLHLAGLK